MGMSLPLIRWLLCLWALQTAAFIPSGLRVQQRHRRRHPLSPSRTPAQTPPLCMNLLDYVNPMYWKREYLVGAVLGSQVPPAAAVVLELYAEDAKRFFYYQSSVVQVVVAPPLSEQLAAKGLGRAEVEKAEKEMTEAAGRAKKSVLMKPLDGTPSNSVDAVVCVQAARRVAEAGRLSDLARVLKPGGRVVFLEEPEDLAVLDAVGDQFEAVELLDEQDGLAVGYALVPQQKKGPTAAAGAIADGGGANRQQRREEQNLKKAANKKNKKKKREVGGK